MSLDLTLPFRLLIRCRCSSLCVRTQSGFEPRSKRTHTIDGVTVRLLLDDGDRVGDGVVQLVRRPRPQALEGEERGAVHGHGRDRGVRRRQEVVERRDGGRQRRGGGDRLEGEKPGESTLLSQLSLLNLTSESGAKQCATAAEL